MLLIIPALRRNFGLLFPSSFPVSLEVSQVYFGCGSLQKPFWYVSLKNGHIAFSYIIAFLEEEEGEQIIFLETQFGDRRPLHEAAPKSLACM